MICCLILAAGRSTRMGTSKLLLQVGGQPIIRRVAEAALSSTANRVIVVVGHEAEQVEGELHGLAVDVVPNPDYASGQSASLTAGIRALPAETEAVVVLLGDQPLVSPELIDRLIARRRASMSPVVATECEGRKVPPVLFARSLFPELLEAQGDEGGRQVIRRLGHQVAVVPADKDAVTDVDTWAEYQALVRRIAEGR